MNATNITVNANAIPLRNFFKNPEKTRFKISPDGTYIAFMAPHNDRMNIFVQSTSTNDTWRITNESDRDISDYTWADNNRLMYLKDTGGDENYHLYSVDKMGKETQCLTPFEGVKVDLVDDLPDIDNEVLISMNKRNRQCFDIYRLNIVSGDMEMVAQNPGNVARWLTDHNGKIRIALVTDGVSQQLLYREREQEEFKTVLATNFRDQLSPLFFAFDNPNQVYAISNLGRDKMALVLFDLHTGKEIKELYAHPNVDVIGANYSRKRKVLTVAWYETWRMNIHYFDQKSADLYARLYELVGTEQQIYVTSVNKTEDTFLFVTSSDKSRAVYYLYNRNTDELQMLAQSTPWLNTSDMASMKAISYTSRDGLTIHGYLTLPNNIPAKNLPVIVNPHGGPWWRDSWGFNPEVQFLANRGYAILQMNFRGSTGYGRKFWEASFKQWGLNMQNDITDGVNWLIEKGIADPKRLAIYGGSYGGYATLAGVAFTPNLYACAIDFVGVSNLFTFMETIPPYWEPMLAMMYEMVGHPENDKEQLRATSPVFHVDKIKTPLFVAQGAKDPRVNVNESEQIVDALRQRGVTVQYMVKADEGHGFMNQENKFEFYEAMEIFLAKHLA